MSEERGLTGDVKWLASWAKKAIRDNYFSDDGVREVEDRVLTGIAELESRAQAWEKAVAGLWKARVREADPMTRLRDYDEALSELGAAWGHHEGHPYMYDGETRKDAISRIKREERQKVLRWAREICEDRVRDYERGDHPADPGLAELFRKRATVLRELLADLTPPDSEEDD